ncbi:MAG: hypothetical protein ACRDIC_19530 [bacterium]
MTIRNANGGRALQNTLIAGSIVVSVLSVVGAVFAGVSAVISPLQKELDSHRDELYRVRQSIESVRSKVEMTAQRTALVNDKFVEVETQFRGMAQVLQQRESKWVTMISILWRKVFQEDPPPFPIIDINPSRNGADRVILE